jgi:hypothetical protein
VWCWDGVKRKERVDLRLGYICICEMFFPDFRTDGGWFSGWYHRDPGLRVSFA